MPLPDTGAAHTVADPAADAPAYSSTVTKDAKGQDGVWQHDNLRVAQWWWNGRDTARVNVWTAYVLIEIESK